MSGEQPLLDWALWYYDRGFCVLPVKAHEKRPALDTWKQYQVNRPTREQVIEWFRGKTVEDLGIGVLCGRVSGKLVIFDFDDMDVYNQLGASFEHEVRMVRTGSGKLHLWLRSERVPKSFKISQIGLEVRSEANFVVVPPSIHPSGKPYTFVDAALPIFKVFDAEDEAWKIAERLGMDRRVHKSVDVDWKPDVHRLRPCFQAMLRGENKGALGKDGLSHDARMAFVHEALSVGFGAKTIPPEFSEQPDYGDGSDSEYYVKELCMTAVEEGIHPWHCDTMIKRDWCIVEDGERDKCYLRYCGETVYHKEEVPPQQNEEQEIEAILNSPSPLAEAKPHLDELVAGEDTNKQLLFTLLMSGRIKDPEKTEMIMLKSESGGGKSTLANAVTQPFNTKKVGRFTEHALDYADLSRYDVLYIQEIGHMDEEKQGLSTIKFLSADDQGYTVEMTQGSVAQGFTTVEKRIPPMTVICSTTRVEIDPQFERRNWIISIDETPEQTERIRKFKARRQREKNEINLGLREELSSERAKRILTQLVEQYEASRVVILFPETFLEILEGEKLRTRGDYEKILRMLEYYCGLKKRTLPKIKGKDGDDVIFATPQAALEILEVAKEPITLMTLGLDKRTRKLLDGFADKGITAAGMVIDPTLRQELAIKLGYSSDTLRIYLNELVAKKYLTDDDKRPKSYKMVYSLAYIKQKASAISEKIENTGALIFDMCTEALKNLETLSVKLGGGEIDEIKHYFNPSHILGFSDSESGESGGSP